MKALSIAVLVGSVFAAGPAFAQGDTETVPTGTRLGPSTLPSQIVCVRYSEIGSRLRFRKVCRTRAEWREHRREVRLELETMLTPTTGG